MLEGGGAEGGGLGVICQVLEIEVFRPEWYISTIYHARDAPFWLGTLEIDAVMMAISL